jgi:hypothetical protein
VLGSATGGRRCWRASVTPSREPRAGAGYSPTTRRESTPNAGWVAPIPIGRENGLAIEDEPTRPGKPLAVRRVLGPPLVSPNPWKRWEFRRGRLGRGRRNSRLFHRSDASTSTFLDLDSSESRYSARNRVRAVSGRHLPRARDFTRQRRPAFDNQRWLGRVRTHRRTGVQGLSRGSARPIRRP